MTHLVLYDGVCGLCNRFVQFMLRVDRHDRLRFAALQGAIGSGILQAHGRPASEISTVIVVPDYMSPSPRLLDRSDAALFVVASVGGIYRVAALFRIVPRFLRDAVYDLIARSRYRIFGKLEACPVPTAATRAKFLDFAAPASKR